ncbi:MAG: hypothetical protein M3478_08405, partial [Planctomycetota bacterium]|nr:hypothetical protein [Planctomycetota bacterium]
PRMSMCNFARYAGSLALLALVGATPTTGPTTSSTATTTTAPVVRLTDPAFWLERAGAEWDRIDPTARKPWREMAAAQLAVGDRAGLVRTLEAAKTLKPPHVTGYPYVNDPTVRVYADLVPFFAQAGDDEGMHRAIAVATDPSREAGSDANSKPLDQNRESIATKLATVGRDVDALQVARNVRDPLNRTEALAAVAVISARAGRAAESSRAFAAATQAAAAADKTQGGTGRRRLAHGYLDAGNVTKALEVGQSLEDASRAALLSRVAVAHSKAGRTREAAEYAKRATDIVVAKRLASNPLEVVRGVAEAGDGPSIAALVKRADAEQVAPPPPPLPSERLSRAPARGGRRELHPGEAFADQCFIGLAKGYASRGDVQAAKQYLERSALLWRSVNGNTLPLNWYSYALLPVAVELGGAGESDDAVSLADSIPLTISPAEAANNPSARFTLDTLKNNIIQVYENAGKFDQASKLWQERHGGPAIPFVHARVRRGQLEPLLAEIERMPTASSRCTFFANTATELVKRMVPAAEPSHPVRR